MALNITNENYEALLADSKPLVIDFWAEWCGPCRAVAPIVEELAEEYADKVNIGKCDVDSCDDITANYRVRNIPTIVFLKGGEGGKELAEEVVKACEIPSQLEHPYALCDGVCEKIEKIVPTWAIKNNE